MNKKFDLRRKLVEIQNLRLTKEERENKEWKRKVIDSHIQTTLDSKRVLDESRAWRRKIEKSWDEIRKVTKTWNDYEDRFKNAVHNLSIRINEYEKDQENKAKLENLKQETENKRNKAAAISWNRGHFIKFTKLSEMRKREKYIPNAVIHIPRVLESNEYSE